MAVLSKPLELPIVLMLANSAFLLGVVVYLIVTK
jgi:hypothetical protein